MGLVEGSRSVLKKGIREMQLSHDPAVIDAVFDEANLVPCAGLAPVMALAEQAGLTDLLTERLSVPAPNAPLKVTALLAGMVAGADSIEDMELLRHGAMDRLQVAVVLGETRREDGLSHESVTR